MSSKKETDYSGFIALAIIIVGLLALIGSVTVVSWFVAGPCWLAKASMCAGVEPIKGGTYQFEDDSICPCKGTRMIISRECNDEIDKLLNEGYDEVEFCGSLGVY